MKHLTELLIDHLTEQIALEESLCGNIEQNLTELNESKFAEAKSLLAGIQETLTNQFGPLNNMLDQLEAELATEKPKRTGNGRANNGIQAKHLFAKIGNEDNSKKLDRLSKILRDTYSSLNLITISNTLLHTTALALKSQQVAKMALDHLYKLVPFVVKTDELIPLVATRELCTISPDIEEQDVALRALKNVQAAWKFKQLE